MDYGKYLILKLVAVVLLLWAYYPDNPFGYYTFLRIACCALFAWLALQTAFVERGVWTTLFLAAAAIYNPIEKLVLPVEVWRWVNGATILFLLASILCGVPEKEEE